MKGVILAGGKGTRLAPATHVYNKHLALVYDEPMIVYPLKTLAAMGVTEFIVVSTPAGVKGIRKLFKDYENITYYVQEKAGGIAEALQCVPPIKGLFPVILGDNFFEQTPKMPNKPTLFLKAVPDPHRFGVYFQDNRIIEKPYKPVSNLAVTGLYVYDERVFAMLPSVKYSERGEKEITDVNNRYLASGADVVELEGLWKDMGTPDSLLEVANYVRP